RRIMSCCNRRNSECPMPHDGQDLSNAAASPVLNDLLGLTAQATGALDTLVARATETLRARVCQGGRVSGALIETHQVAAHGLAWLATYGQALRQMQDWAGRLQDRGTFGELEQLIHQIAFAEY